MESLEFVVDQYSWYSWVAPPVEFTSWIKTKFERVSFLTKTKNRPIHGITFPGKNKKTYNQENWPPRIQLNDTTLTINVLYMSIEHSA